MNRKGLFSFLLLLAFFSLEIGFLAKATEFKELALKEKAAAFEAEKASLQRTLIENSVDAIVEQELEQGLLLGLEAEEIKWRVNSRILALFKKIEKDPIQGISVEFDADSLNPVFLNANSSLLVSKPGKKVLAEYHFSGGLLKKESVSAKIFGEKTVVFFEIPPGYTVRAFE